MHSSFQKLAKPFNFVLTSNTESLYYITSPSYLNLNFGKILNTIPEQCSLANSKRYALFLLSAQSTRPFKNILDPAC